LKEEERARNAQEFERKAVAIRSNLAKFSHESVIEVAFEYLRRPENDSFDAARKFPHLWLLACEWALQQTPPSNATTATPKDILRLVNKIYALQSHAADFENSLQKELTLRKMLLQQLHAQRNPIFQIYNLLRTHFLIEKNYSNYFVKEFRDSTGVELSDYFELSTWIISGAAAKAQTILYRDLITSFIPRWNTQRLASTLQVIGAPLERLEPLTKERDGPLQKSRYYQDSIFLTFPIVLEKHRGVSPHYSILARALSLKPLETLKANDPQNFRDRFTKNFESYCLEILDKSPIQNINEGDLQRYYEDKKVAGKCVDSMCRGQDDVVFIDAKGIEPHKLLQETDSSKIFSNKLKSSFMKGVSQALESASILSRTGYDLPEKENRFALIVTHQDFYVLHGKKLESQIDKRFIDALKKVFPDAIPIENVYFCPVEDFEGIVDLCTSEEISIGQFISFCRDSDSDPSTSKFEMRQHINEFCKVNESKKSGPVGPDVLSDHVDDYLKTLTSACERNQSYWIRAGVTALPEYLDHYSSLQEYLGVDTGFS
jgi:hypothetical protein